MTDLGADVEQNVFLLKFAVWLVSCLLIVAGLRFLVITTSLEVPFIKQRITAWVANLRQGLLFIAIQAFFFNLAMALRVISEAREVEPIFHYTQQFMLLVFEVTLLAGLLIMGNVVKGAGPSPFREHKEMSHLIDGLEQSEDEQPEESHFSREGGQ